MVTSDKNKRGKHLWEAEGYVVIRGFEVRAPRRLNGCERVRISCGGRAWFPCSTGQNAHRTCTIVLSAMLTFKSVSFTKDFLKEVAELERDSGTRNCSAFVFLRGRPQLEQESMTETKPTDLQESFLGRNICTEQEGTCRETCRERETEWKLG